jgi:hypothetical protein
VIIPLFFGRLKLALWYETGRGLVKTKLARCNIGADVYLCCPGPSLASVQNTDLHIPGVITVAINTAYPHICPDIWIGMDDPQCYDRTLWWRPFMKIARGGYQNRTCEGAQISRCPNVFFADCAEPQDRLDLFRLRAHDVKFVWHKNTLAISLHILVWMGAKKIHLLGCDLGGSKDYYDDRILTEEQRKYNQRLYKHQVDYLKWFANTGKQFDVSLVSCTPRSPINEFVDYYDLNEALLMSNAHVPNPGIIKHVLDTKTSDDNPTQDLRI